LDRAAAEKNYQVCVDGQEMNVNTRNQPWLIRWCSEGVFSFSKFVDFISLLFHRLFYFFLP